MRILYNAKILTLDSSRPYAEAIAINQDKVFALGSNEEILSITGQKIEKINLEGHTIWPGLIDSHIHLCQYAHSLDLVDCDTATKADCIDHVARRAQITPKDNWIIGHGWDHNVWDSGMGCAEDLDQIAPDQPVYLTTKSLHAGWANRAAMQTAGINQDTPDPEGGHIQRDNKGIPTGILFENAVNLIEKFIPQKNLEAEQEAVIKAQNTLVKMGITGVHDFDRITSFKALQRLDANGQLEFRVLKTIPAEVLNCFSQAGIQGGFGSSHLKIGAVKLFADGALGPSTAAMFSPYLQSNNMGMLLINANEIYEAGKKAVENGLSLSVHAIGDRAVHEVLDGFEKIRAYEKENHLTPSRHRIEHAQLVGESDLARMKALNIIASVQPTHATADIFMAEEKWGSERSSRGYAYQTFLDNQIPVTFGSDAPVESPNPFWGIHAAVTRKRRDGTPGGDGWYPQHTLTLFSAIHAYTTGPAFAAGLEKISGKLKENYYADLIVLDADPFKVSKEHLHTIEPIATMISGKWVWQK
jgi:predicted amidohydrolase YtcJ